MNLLCSLDAAINTSVIKDSVVDKLTENQLDLPGALLSVGIALIIGVIIFFVYKKTFSGIVYSANFGISIVLMTIITAAIIATISSNVVLSLGMVGALSIVRFRAAIKDPVDIMYLFWAISAGIIVGAKQYYFAAIASVVIAAVLIVAHFVRGKSEVYLLIVRYHTAAAPRINAAMSSLSCKIRNRTSTAQRSEVTAEIRSGKLPDGLVEKMSKVDGVISAVLVNFNGEYCD